MYVYTLINEFLLILIIEIKIQDCNFLTDYIISSFAVLNSCIKFYFAFLNTYLNICTYMLKSTKLQNSALAYLCSVCTDFIKMVQRFMSLSCTVAFQMTLNVV